MSAETRPEAGTEKTWEATIQDLERRGETMKLIALAEEAGEAAADALIAACSNWTVLWRLAKRPDLTQTQYANLYATQSLEVQTVIAANPAVGAELLEQIHRDVRREGRWWHQLAANPNLPEHLHSEYATSPDVRTRQAYAANPNAAPELLDLLAYDEAPQVRAEAARNPNLDPETLTKIVENLTCAGAGHGADGKLDAAQHTQLAWALRNPNIGADSLIRIAKALWQHNLVAEDPNHWEWRPIENDLISHPRLPTQVKLAYQIRRSRLADDAIDLVESWGIDEEAARVGAELLEDGWRGTLEELQALLTS